MRIISAINQRLFTLCDYCADYFSYYTHYFKTTNGVSGEYSLWKSASMISGGSAEVANHHSQAAGAEAANHPKSSTTIFPCPMDGPIAASACLAAYVSLMYLSQPSRMAGRN
jgi:hypothetical protein